ncbi:MAG: CHAD domain-containing protein [Streptosporangiaceae bacterium]
MSSREFVLDSDAGASADQLLAAAAETAAGAAGGSLRWTDCGPASTCRRTWLDTIDWRLYRAGLTLEQSASRGSAELAVTGRDGETVAVEHLPGAVRWPCLLTGLPAGPLRERLEPVVGVRALLPVARATSRVRELRALNGDAKTIARLAVDKMSVSYPAMATAAPRLILTPVRGYGGHADRLEQALRAQPGVGNGSVSSLAAALAAAGSRPGELPGKASGQVLTPELRAGTALASILTALLDTIEANVPGTLRDIDTEFLHDLRVAVRWTRSALKLCGPALPDGLARRFKPGFRWLGDLTTPTRDLDVYLLGLPAMAAGLIAASEDDLAPFRDHLSSTRAAAHTGLCRGLRSVRFTRLTSDWRAALADVRQARKRPTIAQLAGERIETAHRNALDAGALINSSSPPQSLHDLRKRCKELRYLVEMFGSLYDHAQRWQAVRELKALQDSLGEFQDAEVQLTEIRAFAAEMLADKSAPAATLLAMGEIAAGLAQRQRKARSEFDGRFAAFASPASQQRLAALARTSAA